MTTTPTHTYTLPHPLATPTVHELHDGSHVPVFGRGTTYRRQEPIEVLLTDFGHGPIVLLGSQTYLVSTLTVAELDEALALELADRLAGA